MTWQLETKYAVNSAVARDVGLTLDDNRLTSDRQTVESAAPILGTYNQLIALAKQQRREWIGYNGFNAVRVERYPGYIRYFVYAHFGAPEYDLCIIRRADNWDTDEVINWAQNTESVYLECDRRAKKWRNFPGAVIGSIRAAILSSGILNGTGVNTRRVNWHSVAECFTSAL